MIFKIKRAKKSIFLILFSIISFSFFSQTTEIKKEIIKEKKNAIGVFGGTGLGLDYSRKINKKLFATISFNTLNIEVDNLKQEVKGEVLSINSKFDFNNLDLKLAYHPFSNAFKIIGGLGYFSSSNVNLRIQFQNNVNVGDIVFTSDDIGVLEIDSNWSSIAPYLGFGFGRAVPNKKFGFAIELGSYFSKSPDITLNANGILEETNNQQTLLNETFSSFKFIPNLSFRISYAL